MPSFLFAQGGTDAIRVLQQMTIVAPFYAGLVYTTGAMTSMHHLFKRMFDNSAMQGGPETIQQAKK